MFIARSQARIRAARWVFLLVAIVPTAAVIAWAAYLRSDAHRVRVERAWQTATGLPLAIGGIEHPRPGVIRGRDCRLPATASRAGVTISQVELESSADEDRLRIDRLACDPAVASALASFAREWLMDELRFPRTCLVEVGDFRWAQTLQDGTADGPEPPPPVALRIECVVREGSRAVRVVSRGEAGDEVRIVRQLSSGDADSGERLEIDAVCPTPVPLAVLVAAAGVPASDAAASAGSGRVSGELRGVRDDDGWHGTAEGRISGIDLAATAAAVGGHAQGSARIDIARLAWSHGRLRDGLIECAAGPGWIESRLFDRLVLATGAAPGPAATAAPADNGRFFDAAACLVTIGEQGVQLLPSPHLPGALAVRDAAPLLAPPAGPVPGDRLAWMLTTPGTAFGPTTGPGAWLMSVLPPPTPPATGSGRQF